MATKHQKPRKSTEKSAPLNALIDTLPVLDPFTGAVRVQSSFVLEKTSTRRLPPDRPPGETLIDLVLQADNEHRSRIVERIMASRRDALLKLSRKATREAKREQLDKVLKTLEKLESFLQGEMTDPSY